MTFKLSEKEKAAFKAHKLSNYGIYILYHDLLNKMKDFKKFSLLDESKQSIASDSTNSETLVRSSDYAQLQSEHKELQEKYGNLQDKHINLQNEHLKLQYEYLELLKSS